LRIPLRILEWRAALYSRGHEKNGQPSAHIPLIIQALALLSPAKPKDFESIVRGRSSALSSSRYIHWLGIPVRGVLRKMLDRLETGVHAEKNIRIDKVVRAVERILFGIALLIRSSL
jgi:hypothetical protein